MSSSTSPKNRVGSTVVAALLVCWTPAVALAQATAASLQVNFTASADSFKAATEEYRAIWAKEGSRIVAAMERLSGLRFEKGPIGASVYEGVSYSGAPGGPPMVLRASYPEPTKRGTLVHELAHRLASDVRVPFDHHELIFLFVYDAWVDLWGQAFADEQVAVESKRTGLVDYASIWKKTLAIPASERPRRLQQFIEQYGKPRG
jgi:hypothetical protein